MLEIGNGRDATNSLTSKLQCQLLIANCQLLFTEFILYFGHLLCNLPYSNTIIQAIRSGILESCKSGIQEFRSWKHGNLKSRSSITARIRLSFVGLGHRLLNQHLILMAGIPPDLNSSISGSKTFAQNAMSGNIDLDRFCQQMRLVIVTDGFEYDRSTFFYPCLAVERHRTRIP